MASDFAHAMRAAELALAIPMFHPGCSILELGAGDGWQAATLHSLGFKVIAVDVNPPGVEIIRHFPVEIYDGRKLPFPDASFDFVYSSNVMEHVKHFDEIQIELARVLRSGGQAIHCVPSAVWRFWTTVGHPLYAARLGWRLKKTPRCSHDKLKAERILNETRFGQLLKLFFISPRHGEFGGLLEEHFLFSRSGWAKRFIDSGWKIISCERCGLFYTGNELLSLSLQVSIRQRVAKLLGSSSLIYSLCPDRSH